jgi:hypothetical protein
MPMQSELVELAVQLAPMGLPVELAQQDLL